MLKRLLFGVGAFAALATASPAGAHGPAAGAAGTMPVPATVPAALVPAAFVPATLVPAGALPGAGPA